MYNELGAYGVRVYMWLWLISSSGRLVAGMRNVCLNSAGLSDSLRFTLVIKGLKAGPAVLSCQCRHHHFIGVGLSLLLVMCRAAGLCLLIL